MAQDCICLWGIHVTLLTHREIVVNEKPMSSHVLLLSQILILYLGTEV